jgi:hypothetical protein
VGLLLGDTLVVEQQIDLHVGIYEEINFISFCISFLKGDFFYFFQFFISTLLYLPPVDSVVEEDAEIEPSTLQLQFGIGCQTL